MWKVYVLENGKEKCIYNSRWTPTIDDMSVVAAVRGKVYKVINPQGKDVTKYFPYGTPT
jgi:hypothetical protein